jgi:hypothetical protein
MAWRAPFSTVEKKRKGFAVTRRCSGHSYYRTVSTVRKMHTAIIVWDMHEIDGVVLLYTSREYYYYTKQVDAM